MSFADCFSLSLSLSLSPALTTEFPPALDRAKLGANSALPRPDVRKSDPMANPGRANGVSMGH